MKKYWLFAAMEKWKKKEQQKNKQTNEQKTIKQKNKTKQNETNLISTTKDEIFRSNG